MSDSSNNISLVERQNIPASKYVYLYKSHFASQCSYITYLFQGHAPSFEHKNHRRSVLPVWRMVEKFPNTEWCDKWQGVASFPLTHQPCMQYNLIGFVVKENWSRHDLQFMWYLINNAYTIAIYSGLVWTRSMLPECRDRLETEVRMSQRNRWR